MNDAKGTSTARVICSKTPLPKAMSVLCAAASSCSAKPVVFTLEVFDHSLPTPGVDFWVMFDFLPGYEYVYLLYISIVPRVLRLILLQDC